MSVERFPRSVVAKSDAEKTNLYNCSLVLFLSWIEYQNMFM